MVVLRRPRREEDEADCLSDGDHGENQVLFSTARRLSSDLPEHRCHV